MTEDKENNEQELPDITVVPCYGVLKQGSDRVPIVLKNLTCKPITLKKGRVVAEVGPANAIPAMLAPKIKEEGDSPQGNQEERVEKLFKLLDLKGLETWPEVEQETGQKAHSRVSGHFCPKRYRARPY